MRGNHDWESLMPFWIDTDGYTDRDRLLFVCGVEFEMVRQAFESGDAVTRPIHRENESRIRMMAAKMGISVRVTQHDGYDGCEGWSDLIQLTEGE